MDSVSSSDVADDSEHAKKRKLDSTDVVETVSMSEDDIRKMVKSFNYDQLVQLMTSICVKNADAARTLHDDWSNDVNNRKLYIRNLNFETTTEALHAAFEQFGVIVEAAVIKDKITNKNKGFGFVTFATADEAQKALASPTLSIEGRLASVALAAAGKPVSTSVVHSQSNDLAARKLFVRQLSFDTTELTLQSFFAQYGELQEVFLFREKETGKSKGHAFVTYVESGAAARALQDPVKNIDGRKAIAKLAIEGAADNQKKQQMMNSNTLAAMQNALMPYGMMSNAASMHNIHSAMSAMQFVPGVSGVAAPKPTVPMTSPTTPSAPNAHALSNLASSQAAAMYGMYYGQPQLR